MTAAHAGGHGSWAALTTALERSSGPGRPSGAWVKYCCPVHETGGGHHPSLGIKYLPAEHKTKVKCFAGCDDRDILAALSLKVRDLYDAPITRSASGTARRRPAPARPRTPTRAEQAITAAGLGGPVAKTDLGRQVSRWETRAVYPYARPDGTVAGEVTRREARFERGRAKKFSQRAWTENGWADTGFDPVPFQLPRVLDAVAAGEPIYVCEGEKDVLTAEHMGLTATTNAGGAGSWTNEHAAWLDGAAEVVVLVDRDAPGYRRADKVLATLSGLRVGRVRVLQARDGKDFTDHISAGHDLDELDPVPFLDPEVPAPGTESPSLPGGSVFAHSPEMQQHTDHTPDIDTAGRQMAAAMQLMMQQLLSWAQRKAEARRREQDELKRKSEDERRQAEERIRTERGLVESRLNKLRARGLDNCDREELVRAVADAAAWAPDSDIAKKALTELRVHIHNRYGVIIDPRTFTASEDPERATSPEFVAQIAKKEKAQADSARTQRAHDRMVELVAADKNLSEEDKIALYGAIEKWRTNPTPAQLADLTKEMTDKGVGEIARAKVRFIANYIGAPDAQVPGGQVGGVRSVAPSADLRRMRTVLVDPGEAVKPTMDRLIDDYRARLAHGHDTATVRARLAEAAALLTPEDRAAAREQIARVRANPAAVVTPLWPDHVDRQVITDAVHMYAAMKPQVEAQKAAAKVPDAIATEKAAERAAAYRTVIERAITSGKGLHPLERDQLELTLRDIDAGHTKLPDLLFADDRSAAAADADRHRESANNAAVYHRNKVRQILGTAAAPRDAEDRATRELGSAFAGQTQLGTGAWNLPDYEHRRLDSGVEAALTKAGVPEPVRNQVRKQLDEGSREAASAGKLARQIDATWRARTAAIVAGRGDAHIPDWDGPQRAKALAKDMDKAGLTADERAQRMAADAGRGTPPSAAVRTGPGTNGSRQTASGSGVRRTHHRGTGEPGLGR
ncbi:toprim domain-containing protein [Nocardia sp. NPDC003693]